MLVRLKTTRCKISSNRGIDPVPHVPVEVAGAKAGGGEAGGA